MNKEMNKPREEKKRLLCPVCKEELSKRITYDLQKHIVKKAMHENWIYAVSEGKEKRLHFDYYMKNTRPKIVTIKRVFTN